MRFNCLLIAAAFLTTLPFFAAAEHVLPNAKRHDGLARRVASNQTESQGLGKRDTHQGILTWYHTGMGMCGQWNNEGDFIVAASKSVYFSGSKYPADVCFKTVTIQWQGKTTSATVVDACESCDANHLDASPGLMHFFAQEDQLNDITWWFEGEGPAPPPKSSSTSTTTTHSSTSTPPPSSTKSSTSSTPSSSSTSHSSSSHSTAPASSSSTSTAPTSTSSTPAPTPTEQSAVGLLYQAFLGLAIIADVGANN